MAERQRFATRMIQPGNPMQFSPSVQAQQGDSARLNQMGQVAESLMSLSKSFAGAFRAGAEVSEQEYLRRQKIEQEILEEQKTADVLRGKFTAQQRGPVPQNVLDAESESFQKGYKTQIYTDKIKDDNDYIKALAPNLADKIYARWSQISKEKANNGEQYIPLAEYASVFIQKEKSRMMKGYENDPIAWEVFSKGGLDFNPLQDELAKHIGEESENRRNVVLAQRSIRNHSKTTHKTYSDYEAAAGVVRLPIEGVDFYTREEEQNAFLQDIENRLRVAESSEDPVFRSLDFTTTSKASDGIGFDVSQSKSYGVDTDTVSERYYKLMESLDKKEKELIKKEEGTSKTADEKGKDEIRAKAKVEALGLLSKVTAVKTKPEADELLKQLDDPNLHYRFRWGTGTGAGITLTQVINKLHEIRNSKELNPSRFKPSDEQLGQMEGIKGKLKALASQAKTGKLPTDAINRYDAQLTPFRSIEGYAELEEILGKVRVNKKEYDDKEKKEASELHEKNQKEARGKQKIDLFKRIAKLEKGEIKPDLRADYQKALQLSLDKLDHDDFVPVIKHFASVVKQLSEGDRLTQFTNNGIDAESKALELTTKTDVTDSELETQIEVLENTYNIDAKSKKSALKTMYDRLFEVRNAKLDKNTLEAKRKLRKQIYSNSEKRDKLEEYIQKATEEGHDDLVKEAQGYINVLNTREYNDKIYGQRLVEAREYNKQQYDIRTKETRAYQEKQRNIQRQWSIDLKKIDLQIQQAIKEQDRKYANELWEKRQELNEQKRIDIRNEKRAWKEHISKKYKDEDEAALTSKMKKRKKVFELYIDISDRLEQAVEEGNREEVRKIRKEYLEKFNNAEFAMVPELDELMQSDLKNANIILKRLEVDKNKDNTALSFKQQESNSEGEYQTKQIQRLLQINNLLNQDIPDTANAEKLVGEMFALKKYDEGTKGMLTKTKALFDESTQLRLYNDIRVAKHKHEAKTTHKKGTTSPVVLTTIHTKLNSFPVQKENEKIDVFDKRAQKYHADNYKIIVDNFVAGNLSEPTFNRLKNSIDSLLAGGEQARIERIKSNPIDIVNSYRKQLYILVGKPDITYFNLKGAANFLDSVTTSRNELYSAMLEEYDLRIAQEYNTNKEFREHETVRIDRANEIYTSIIEAPVYKNQLDNIKNQLKVPPNKGKKDEGFGVRVFKEDPNFKKNVRNRLKNYLPKS